MRYSTQVVIIDCWEILGKGKNYHHHHVGSGTSMSPALALVGHRHAAGSGLGFAGHVVGVHGVGIAAMQVLRPAGP